MHDTYEFFGCIDFRTDSYAISVPLLKREGSNYIYVPKTDQNFIVTDFYEMLDIGYDVQPISVSDYREISIGQKTPVPILESGHVFVIDPEWSDDEIRSRYPDLGTEAFKAFISLRSRMAGKAPQVNHDEVGVGLDDLLSDPVRSRYWISRYSALVRSAFETGDPPASLKKRLEEARLQWLEKFASKTSLKHIKVMLELPHMPLDQDARRRVLMTRFERLLLAKGIFIPTVELRAYAQMFPDGILLSLFDDDDDRIPHWQRHQTLSRFLSDQMFELTQKPAASEPRGADPDKWPKAEVDRLLEFFTALTRDSYRLDEPCKYLLPLFQRCLQSIKLRTAKRHALINAIESRDDRAGNGWDYFDLGWSEHVHDYEVDWIEAVKKLIDDYDKLIAVSKIVRPLTRSQAESEIAFPGVDHALIDALRTAYRNKNLRSLRGLLV